MEKYGSLFHENDIKLHRKYFAEMVKLWGVLVDYYAPKKNNHRTIYGEVVSSYYEPMRIGVLFNQHPDQKTMKKLGWDNQTDTEAILITVPYDTPNIQVGAKFLFPAAVDGGEPKQYKVTRMRTSMIYPSSIVCECMPEYEDEFKISDFEFAHTGMNVINREQDNISLT